MKNLIEEWKTIEEFPKYQISNFGRCKRIEFFTDNHLTKGKTKFPERMLKMGYDKNNKSKLCPNCTGYNLWSGRMWKRRSAGRLVATAFIPNPNGYKLIRYKDGNTLNPHHMNIEWIKDMKIFDGNKSKSEKYAIYNTKEDQLNKYDESIKDIIKLKESIESDSIESFVCEVFIKYLEKVFIICTLNPLLKDDFFDYATDKFIRRIKEGCLIFSLHNMSLHMLADYRKEYILKKKSIRSIDGRLDGYGVNFQGINKCLSNTDSYEY